MNYDCLSAIALELNEGEKFEETIKDLNIINTHDRKRQYDVQLFTEEGIIFTSENKELDLLNGDTNDIWVEDSEGNSINIEFSANNAIFDNKQNSFIVYGNNVKICDDYEYVDKAKEDIYKNLHCAYIKFSQSYNDYLHYKLI